jgi:hypothetical protein
MDISELFGGNAADHDSEEQYQAILERVRTVPPSCLGGFTCNPAHAAEWDNFARWSIACKCGNTHGAVLGYPLDELTGDDSLRGQFAGPLAFRCAACDTVTEMFDSAAHGYNAMISPPGKSFDASHRGDGPRSVAACPGCAEAECAVVGEFGHSHFDHIEDEPDLLDVAQDYFDGFACKATCANCGKERWVASFELA